ncbi:hypothetical protein WN51_02275 [Melipona quadrifasciata]|uniref:Uncharacterized protein n=1 Tax=Melipona quadrifasciata TaxID=166423 RepID=A0A0N1ITA3_9HYME|nr:hypothetical protein WN51_02275 [Melipona quadrifasciata]
MSNVSYVKRLKVNDESGDSRGGKGRAFSTAPNEAKDRRLLKLTRNDDLSGPSGTVALDLPCMKLLHGNSITIVIGSRTIDVTEYVSRKVKPNISLKHCRLNSKREPAGEEESKKQDEGEKKDEETNRAVNFLGPAFVDAVASAVSAVDVVPPKLVLTEAGGEVKGLSDSRKSTRLFIFLISFGSTDIRLPLISSFTSLRYIVWSVQISVLWMRNLLRLEFCLLAEEKDY